ncbi:rhodanese-like domain-containing protein [Methylibium petroleiphilum]|uniref:rhodanese-like domain-containing protein n=1 Tax=Methylibium petroleiphilum TaxID=105560 RepID=UPI003D2D5A1F
MPTQLASLDSLVHPHQIEVQEFDSYGLVIDARSSEAYQEDHIPGAVSVPVASQRLQVSNAEETTLVASDVEPSVPYALAGHLSGLSAGASVLVYCDRGGLDSLVWADPLKALGYRVDVLGGGWGNYRRWVDAGLEVLPRALTFRRLVAPPAGGMCRVIDRLAKLGEQVLDLTALAGQRLVPGLTLVGDTPPSQAAFETALMQALRSLDPRRPVWARDTVNGLGEIALPPSLRDALQRAECLRLEVPPMVRAQAWAERMHAMGIDICGLLHAISESTNSPSEALVNHWRSIANGGHGTDALAEIITGYFDPLGQVAQLGSQGQVVRLASLTVDAVATELELWRTPAAWHSSDSTRS